VGRGQVLVRADILIYYLNILLNRRPTCKWAEGIYSHRTVGEISNIDIDETKTPRSD
jgi:hypothetical protein